ncbi:putative disease resistance protein RGA3 isoform X2 [Setaria viridis]|uniref:putative disease resistance protein RGA3 isoform X2 n=1 Tax=Setaria viridis TaxID=4556 RepID=UPI001493CB4D|nr:putative disease resistance protein RGA3 isoform X1 [Setaria viridis]
MAAILDALAPYVKKLISDMAQEEVSMLLGVSGEIEKQEGNIEGLKAFLADAERRRITDQSVQRWVRKLKDAMYDATDIIDLCQLEAADKRRGSTEERSSVKKKVSVGCFQPLLLCMRNPVFAHKIGTRIKELNQRLDGIHKEADRFNFSINLGSNPEPRKLTDTERSMQKTTSEFNESAIAGEKIEQDTRELAQLLISGGLHDMKVVSIVGTGGMGKTTLAQKIFNEVTIQEHFKVKVWLSITQHFDEIELLKTAIEHAGGVHGGTQDKTLLTRTLTNTLSTGRFLLIMDDVWSDQAWSHVLSVPIRKASQKQQGNWVLITTRSEDLAQRMGASFYQHHVSPLNEEDAWSLLTKQLPPSPNQVEAEYKFLSRLRSYHRAYQNEGHIIPHQHLPSCPFGKITPD